MLTNSLKSPKRQLGTYFLILDGDKVGDLLAAAYLSNNEGALVAFDQKIRSTFKRLEDLLRSHAFTMIATGADGITCKGVVEDAEVLFSEINGQTSGITVSMGVGVTLQHAFIALKYAKANGRACWAENLSNGLFHFGPKRRP